MGLDIVELIMAVEAGFGVDIPNEEASRMTTPRHVVAFLRDVLPAGMTTSCISQRAFYRLRMHCERHLGVRGHALAPDTPLNELVDAEAQRGAWEAIGFHMGAERWPPPRSPGWWGRAFESESPATLGAAAQYAATWYPRAVKGPESGWTTAEIERAVLALIVAETAADTSVLSLDSRFVDDLGLD